MGLIQRVIEKTGIATIGVSIVREYTEKVRPPRTVFVRSPFGHPFGHPRDREQQRTIVIAALEALDSIKTPGEIIDLPIIIDSRRPTTLKSSGAIPMIRNR